MKSQKIKVRGTVQGVYFRKYTQAKAEELGLKGWVANRLDGSVDILAMGGIDTMEQFKKWLWTGSPGSMVGSVAAEETNPQELEGFSIIDTF